MKGFFVCFNLTKSDLVLESSLIWNKWIGNGNIERLLQKSECGMENWKKEPFWFSLTVSAESFQILPSLYHNANATYFRFVLQANPISGKVVVLVTYC